MINYGAAPAHNEVEVTLFGPGFGEAIAVHLGDGAWILVDSCVDPDTNEPAAAAYLNRIGVGLDKVLVVVASHWHDDHVRGIAALAQSCPNAEFVVSAVFNKAEATAFLAAYGGNSSNGLSRGVKELFKVIEGRAVVNYAMQKFIVLEKTLNGRPVRVTALSPVPAAFERSIAHMAKYLPKAQKPNNHAPEPKQNLEAIVLHIDLDNDAVLLGADLEEHENLGWNGVVQNHWCCGRKASSAFKVAHHGSVTGDNSAVWAQFLVPDVVACLTPFNLGDVHLPKDSDRTRIRGKTPHRFITSGASRSPEMDSRLLKRVKDICKNLSKADPAFGAVRLRKQLAAPAWNVELFGAAAAL